MTHEEAMKTAAAWYRRRYEIDGEIECRSTQDDDTGAYYCELYNDDMDYAVGVNVQDGIVEYVGEGIEYIKVRKFAA